MKIHVAFIIFLITSISLFAQTSRRQQEAAQDIFIYIPLVTGQGSSRADNEFITGLLTEEVIRQNYVVISSDDAADFVLTGNISI